MILQIIKYGDPILRTRGRRVEEIDDRIRALAADMIETVRAANGVGLAAQQIGQPYQLTVLDVTQLEDRPSTLTIDGRKAELAGEMPMVLLNPELKMGAELGVGLEGCLSFPEITADIPRAISVEVRAQRLDGSEVFLQATGLLARALQHEVDHLNGILFIDRMNSATKASVNSRLKKLRRETQTNAAAF